MTAKLLKFKPKKRQTLGDLLKLMIKATKEQGFDKLEVEQCMILMRCLDSSNFQIVAYHDMILTDIGMLEVVKQVLLEEHFNGGDDDNDNA